MVLIFFSLVTYIQNIQVIFEREIKKGLKKDFHPIFIFKSQSISLMNLGK